MAAQGCFFWDETNGQLCGNHIYKNGLCQQHYDAKNSSQDDEDKGKDESKKVHKREEVDVMTKKNSEIFLKKSQVTFECYIILDDKSVVSAGDATDDTKGGSSNNSKNHPDQTFFNRKLPQKVANLLNAGRTIKVIITDCSAYPCKECFIALPPLMRTYFSLKGGEKIPIIMYGHKVESDKGLSCMCTTDTDSGGLYSVDVWSWK